MAYVEEACSQCGLILPKYALSHTVSEAQTGRVSGAVTTGTYASGKARYTVKSGQKIFQTREEWLCPDCRDDRLAQAAAVARGRLIKWSLVALGIVVLLAFIRLAPNSSTVSETNSAPTSQPQASVANQAPAQAEPLAASEPLPDNASAAAAPEPVVPAHHPFMLDGLDLTQDLAFRAAAREALETGEPVLWGERNGGEVRVGPLDETGDQACRVLAYTVHGARSTDIFMCRDAQGRWTPR